MRASELVDYWSKLGNSLVHPDDFGLVDPTQFCIDQLPIPWVGNLMKANAFVLMLNPRYSDEDKRYELKNPEFRKAVNANLSGCVPIYSFQSQFQTYPGYAWARRVYGHDVLQECANSVCQINLVPYHSAEGGVATRISGKLPTSLAIQRFVLGNLVPRARRGEIGLVVARSSRGWGIDASMECECIVVYKDGETRGAYQTGVTRGGKLIRRFLFANATIAKSGTGQNREKMESQVEVIDPTQKPGHAGRSGFNQTRRRDKFETHSTDQIRWRVGTRVEASAVRITSKRYQWLKAMQSVDSFSAAKLIRVMLDGIRIDDINMSHVKWAVENGFLIVVEHVE